MGKIQKSQIITDICNKRVWDINEANAKDATKNISDKVFRKYSVMHYKTVYCIIRNRVDMIEDTIDKIAYIDCLAMNYADMDFGKYNTILDVVCGFMSGSLLGLSITDTINDRLGLLIAFLSIIVLQSIKVINIIIRKWNFYQMILARIKEELVYEIGESEEKDI